MISLVSDAWLNFLSTASLIRLVQVGQIGDDAWRLHKCHTYNGAWIRNLDWKLSQLGKLWGGDLKIDPIKK